jgi:hypothetical protein
MQGPEMMVAILIPLSFFAMIFGIVYLFKKENLAMIEKGMNPKDKLFRPAPFRSLKWGLLLLGAGLGLFFAYMLDVYTIPYDREPVGLYFSLIAIGGGLGLVGSYFVEKKHWYDKNNGSTE